jgi:hypothetical protein
MKLHVYYGNERRWDQANLDRIQKTLGKECAFFDGLEAVFDCASKNDALLALLRLRGLGVRAEVDGVGQGPTEGAMREARDAMRISYDTYKKQGG